MGPYCMLGNTVRGIADLAIFGTFGILLAGASALVIRHFIEEWEEQRRLLGREEQDDLEREAERAEARIFSEAIVDSVDFVTGRALGLIENPSQWFFGVDNDRD